MSVQVNCWFICHARTLNSAQQLKGESASETFSTLSRHHGLTFMARQ